MPSFWSGWERMRTKLISTSSWREHLPETNPTSGDFGFPKLSHKTLVLGYVPARFCEDIVDAHIPAGIFCRMIMNMDMPDIWKRFVKQQFYICGNAVSLPDSQ